MKHLLPALIALNGLFAQGQVDWSLRFSDDVMNVAFGEEYDFLTTRTSVFRSVAGMNEWIECNWTLGIVRDGTSVLNGLSWNNERLVVAALDNGYFMSEDLGESFVQTGPTGFGCGSESILHLDEGDLVATMGGFQRGLWKCGQSPSTNWSRNYSVGADQRDIQQVGEDLFAVSHSENHPGGILQSSDYGGSWQLVFGTQYSGNPSSYVILENTLIFISWDGVVHHIDMTNWSELTSFSSAIVSPSDMLEIEGVLFLTSWDGGVYRSEDLGQTWEDIGPNNSSFYKLVLQGDELFAAGETGLWTLSAPGFSLGCNDPFASNFNAVGDCTYCTPSNAFDSSPSEEFTIGSGLSNDHMNVGIDPCNGITASLGVLERYVGNVEPQAGNLSNYQVNTGFADVPDGGDAGSRWNYLLSVNLGEYVFADVEVKFGLDFDPADDFDADNLEESYTIFGSFAEAWPLVAMVTGVDYPQESIFQDSQNFDFGFWSQLAEGADVDFDPNAVGVYNLGVYVYSLEGTLLASSEISVETLLYAGCTDPDACNYDPDAFEDDDSCIYPVAGGTCDDYCSLALPDTIVQCFNSSTLIEAGVQRGTFFDGVDDWILTSESGVTGMNPMSVSFWALTDHNGAMDIFTQASDDDSWADIRFGMNTPQCGLVGPSFKSPAHFATFPYPVDNRNWHHYAYVLGDGSMSFSNLKIYVDGELHSASTGEEFCGHNWGGWTYDAADVPIRFGVGLPLGGFYSGYLDDMALWSKALSQDEVFEIVANDAMAVSEDLVSFWPLDQLEDGFFLDVVGNNHGAPVGGVGTETPLPQGVVTWFSGSQMPNVVVTPNQTTAYSIQSILESGQVCADTTVVEVIDFEYADLNGNGICDQLEGEGCMDLMACNYSEFALVDDGSCDFSCCPGPGCCSSPNVWDPATQMCVNTAASCGEGTVWDESLQQCLPEDMCFADLDNNGVVGMSDLLDLLARFGLECAD